MWYLSGPMSGYTDLNFPLFHRVTTAFRAQGVGVINPAEHAPADTAWEDAMAEDFALLDDACGVILLPGWEFSSGARLEWAWARMLGIPRLPLHVAWALLVGRHQPLPESIFESGHLLTAAVVPF